MRRPRRTGRSLSDRVAGEKFTRDGMGGVRPPHPPEHNLIQRPDLLRDLRDYLQLKQMHITPALAENIQAVVVLDDLGRRQVPQRRDRQFLTVAGAVGDGLTKTAVYGIRNPTSGRTRIHVTRVAGVHRNATFARMNTATLEDSALPGGLTAAMTFDRKLVPFFPAIAGGTTTGFYGTLAGGGFDMQPGHGGLDMESFDLTTDLWCEPGVWPFFQCTSIAAADGFYLMGMEWSEEVIT